MESVTGSMTVNGTVVVVLGQDSLILGDSSESGSVSSTDERRRDCGPWEGSMIGGCYAGEINDSMVTSKLRCSRQDVWARGGIVSTGRIFVCVAVI